MVGIGAPRAKRGVHTRTGGARTGESITARGERCWWAAWGREGSAGTDRQARHTWVLFFTALVNKFY